MGIRISEMEEATTFGVDDYVPIVTNGTNKKALGQKIKDFIAGFFVAKDDNSRLITSLGQTFTDCDAVVTAGMYYNNMGNVSNAPAGTMLSSNGGQLIVTQRASDVRVFQTLYVYIGNGNKTEIYVRAQKNATSFADWRHITAADGISFNNTGSPFVSSNVENALKELNIITVEQKSFPIVYSSATNPVSTGYYDVSKQGYTALGVLSWAVVGSSSTITYVNACALDTTISALNQLYFAVRATQQGTYDHTLLVKILYIKN